MSEDAAAMWGLAENLALPLQDRLVFALRALEHYGKRIIECPSEEALYALLVSMNTDGIHPEIACNPAHPFIAGLWDVDYAAKVHYTMTDPDSGQPIGACGCSGGKPTVLKFPIEIVLVHDPDPADTLDPMDAWWRDE